MSTTVLVPDEFIELHIKKDAFTVLHSAIIDLVMTVRSIKQTSLLLYLKKALITLYIDEETSEEINVEELQSAIQEDNPLPSITLDMLSIVIASINTRLEPLEFEIAESKDMDDSSINIFSFINKKPSGAIRLSTKYSQNDIQIVRRVIDRIFSSDYVNKNSAVDDEGVTQSQITYSVPYMKMVKYLKDGPEIQSDNEDDTTPIINHLSLDESDLFLKDLENYGWLERNYNNYTLGTRGLVELKKYLIDTYGKYPVGTISTCYGCGDILTRGLACPSTSCNIRFHPYCCELVKKSRDTDSCPNNNCSEEMKNFYTF